MPRKDVCRVLVAAAQLDCKCKPTTINSKRHISVLFSYEANMNMNESYCVTARKGTLERSSWRPVGTPDSWRHLFIIIFACGKTYCRRRCRFRLAARPRWPQSGPARHSGSWRQSRQTRKLWPDLWFQIDLHGQPDGRRRRWSDVDKHADNKKKANCTVNKSILQNTHPVQIGVWVFWHVVVKDNVDSLNVHSSAKEISGYQDPPLEILKLLIARQSAGTGDRRDRKRYQHKYWSAPSIHSFNGNSWFDQCDRMLHNFT